MPFTQPAGDLRGTRGLEGDHDQMAKIHAVGQELPHPAPLPPPSPQSDTCGTDDERIRGGGGMMAYRGNVHMTSTLRGEWGLSQKKM